jgi:hypothetical protein
MTTALHENFWFAEQVLPDDRTYGGTWRPTLVIHDLDYEASLAVSFATKVQCDAFIRQHVEGVELLPGN